MVGFPGLKVTDGSCGFPSFLWLPRSVFPAAKLRIVCLFMFGMRSSLRHSESVEFVCPFMFWTRSSLRHSESVEAKRYSPIPVLSDEMILPNVVFVILLLRLLHPLFMSSNCRCFLKLKNRTDWCNSWRNSDPLSLFTVGPQKDLRRTSEGP